LRPLLRVCLVTSMIRSLFSLRRPPSGPHGLTISEKSALDSTGLSLNCNDFNRLRGSLLIRVARDSLQKLTLLKDIRRLQKLDEAWNVARDGREPARGDPWFRPRGARIRHFLFQVRMK
jgi:hypothetical protein